jgi:3-dehydroquinate synthase
MTTVKVSMKRSAANYNIHIGSGFLRGTAPWPIETSGRAAIISNKRVFGLYGAELQARLSQFGVESAVHLIGDGERFKSFRTLDRALDFLGQHKFTRTDTVIALGGGVVGDLAGFAAAVHLRGVSFLQIPTTLLAMIDSSVGGKTGINTSMGKNLVGAFHQPSAVILDTDTLKTLPKRELNAGLFESVKHGVLSGEPLFSRTAEIVGTRDLNAGEFAAFLADQVSFKASIVAGDEFESPDAIGSKSRKTLNLGHTFAHALERATDYRYLKHGEAVGYGLLFAAELSKKLELIDDDVVRLLYDVVHRVGQLPPIEHIPAEELLNAFGYDKKVVSGELQWILFRSIGEPVIIPQSNITSKLLLSVIKRFISSKNS